MRRHPSQDLPGEWAQVRRPVTIPFSQPAITQETLAANLTIIRQLIGLRPITRELIGRQPIVQRIEADDMNKL